MAVQWLTVSGVLWDIAAALYLAKGLTSTDDEIRKGAGSYYDISPPALRSLCSDRINIRWGLFHFLIGAGLQLVSAFGLSLDGWPSSLTVLPIALLALWHLRYSAQAVAVRTLRIGVKAASQERVWRKQFEDLSDADWRSAVKRSGVVFAPPA